MSQQTLPEGVTILPIELARIESALEELKKTTDAHASLNVQVNLHIHYEYPKHIQLGQDTVVVNSEDEEDAKRLAYEAAQPQPASEPPSAPADPNPAIPAPTQGPTLVIETKEYSDGSSATGPAPLPDQSPAQQDAENAAANKAADESPLS
jgi:hypothetical protein